MVTTPENKTLIDLNENFAHLKSFIRQISVKTYPRLNCKFSKASETGEEAIKTMA